MLGPVSSSHSGCGEAKTQWRGGHPSVVDERRAKPRLEAEDDLGLCNGAGTRLD